MIYRSIKTTLLAILATLSLSVTAGPNDPLFVSLTSDEPHRATMALNLGGHMADAGHPLSVFLSDKYPAQQKMLLDIITKGGLVIMCPPCLRHYGFTEADLLPGIKLGGAKVTGEALFKPNTKTLSW